MSAARQTHTPTTLRITLEDIRMGTRILRTLPGLLRRPIRPHAARATVAARLADRSDRFLRLVKRCVYEHPMSPYRALLALAGCEYGDLAGLVAREGVEEALGVLLRHGVYLTVEEFKGRRPVERGRARLDVDPAGLRNPDSMAHIVTQSSGSRGPGSPVPIDVRCWWDRAADTVLFLEARGGTGWRHAVWGVPGGAALADLLRASFSGNAPVRWFSQVDPTAPDLQPRYRWSARLVRWASAVAGVPLPGPEHVAVENSLPIARWMAEVRRAGEVPHLVTFPSSAVRICIAALDAGVDVAGAQFSVAGEPITRSRLDAARRAGAELVPYYAASPCGHIAYACLAPAGPDDLHLLHDLHALVQPASSAVDGRLPAGNLFITELLPTTPMVLLNVSLGDHAALTIRRCGCPLERLGWTTHLSAIQSHEKLTAGGMTFLNTDVVRILEEVLPALFGGGPTDYQLSETEGSDGAPRLALLVHPRVGEVETGAVTEAFLAALDGHGGVERVMALAWRGSGLIHVERRPPLATATGKILHLHTSSARDPSRVADDRMSRVGSQQAHRR
jgi:hypothetical protein